MKMEKKFRGALLKVLEDKTFKSVNVLCGEAGVDHAGIVNFVNTMKFQAGECPEPSRVKNNLNLDVVSKLIDVMGGELVFPWDSPEAECQSQLKKFREENENLKMEIVKLKAQKEAFMELIGDKFAASSTAPEEPRQNKSCA
ncbi:hypothetical protein [Desulfovibrio sp. SGI.169]|uniref:hypothetical protein n=1 Tax=Desulfovibrio sp. SGI.169 TaxID=3420561 RepID=UPI003CFF4378